MASIDGFINYEENMQAFNVTNENFDIAIQPLYFGPNTTIRKDNVFKYISINFYVA